MLHISLNCVYGGVVLCCLLKEATFIISHIQHCISWSLTHKNNKTKIIESSSILLQHLGYLGSAVARPTGSNHCYAVIWVCMELVVRAKVTIKCWKQIITSISVYTFTLLKTTTASEWKQIFTAAWFFTSSRKPEA